MASLSAGPLPRRRHHDGKMGRIRCWWSSSAVRPSWH